jgi:hypothetical protein
MAFEEQTRGFSEVAVVVDEENPTRHDAILPAHATMHSVASPTISTSLADALA